MDKKVILKTLIVGDLQTNCYIMGCLTSKEAIVIDPGANAQAIFDELGALDLKLKSVVVTHGHFDHIGVLGSFNVPVYIHSADAPLLRDTNKNLSASFAKAMTFDPELRLLKDEDIILLGSLSIRVLHTPGHTPGGICLAVEDILISGDTLFKDGIGRTDMPGGSYTSICRSIKEKLFVLDPQTRVLPGHGLATTIAQECRDNAYV